MDTTRLRMAPDAPHRQAVGSMLPTPTTFSARAEVATADDIAKATSTSTKMSLALGVLGRHVYGGTVAPAVVARRRAATKAARRARRAHR